MCKVIVYGDADFSLYDDNCWTAEDKRNAHLNAIESFEFIYTLISYYALYCI